MYTVWCTLFSDVHTVRCSMLNVECTLNVHSSHLPSLLYFTLVYCTLDSDEFNELFGGKKERTIRNNYWMHSVLNILYSLFTIHAIPLHWIVNTATYLSLFFIVFIMYVYPIVLLPLFILFICSFILCFH